MNKETSTTETSIREFTTLIENEMRLYNANTNEYFLRVPVMFAILHRLRAVLYAPDCPPAFARKWRGFLKESQESNEDTTSILTRRIKRMARKR